MGVSSVQKVLAAICCLLGVGIFVGLYFVAQWAATKHATTDSIFVVGIIATVLSPIGFGLLTTAWRLIRPPSHELIRRQAAAATQLERSLNDWEFAESQLQQAEATKAAIDSYIELRTRKLDLERRRMAWGENAQRLYEERAELNDLAAALGEDEAAMSPQARAVLDKIVKPTQETPFAIAVGALGTELTVNLPLLGNILKATFNAARDNARKRHVKGQMPDSGT